MKCPKSFAFWRKICMQYPDSNKRLLVDCVHYVADSIIAKNKTLYQKSHPEKMTYSFWLHHRDYYCRYFFV